MEGYAVKHVIVQIHHVIMFMDALENRVSTKTIHFKPNIFLTN